MRKWQKPCKIVMIEQAMARFLYFIQLAREITKEFESGDLQAQTDHEGALLLQCGKTLRESQWDKSEFQNSSWEDVARNPGEKQQQCLEKVMAMGSEERGILRDNVGKGW